MTSESIRLRQGRVQSRKPARAQATVTARRPPSARLSRIRSLENQVQELEERLYVKEIEFLVDLRIASGLIIERERSESARTLGRIPADVLRLMRQDLVKVLAKVNGATSPPASSMELSRGDEPYIA